MCLNRVRGGPLDIIATEPESDRTWRTWQGEPALQNHTKNVRSLSLTARTSKPIDWTIHWLYNLKQLCCLQELSVTFVRNGVPAPASINTSPPAGIPLDLGPVANQLHTLRLQKVNANWSGCTFNKLCILKLSDISELNSSKLWHILACSPTLQFLELARTLVLPRGPKSEPILRPNLKTIHLCYLHELSIGTILDMFAPGTYNIELYLDSVSISSQRARRKDIPDLACIIRRVADNITILGVSSTEVLGQLSTAFTVALKDLETLCLEDIKLPAVGLARVEETINKLPHIKTIRVVRAKTTDTKAFKDMLQRCSAERRIELVDSWAVSAGKEHRIGPETLLCEWILTYAPNVSFPQG
ncbi:unnamed protein product [Rhizoctonia solani]|uniref:Uncharacterized protein n=1 Tax=Rhizoctonia solani TaxID=456999 RepID=A0A8H2XIL0_9AGAM|nr:unnamed protein product [Rhizoctonia solani]